MIPKIQNSAVSPPAHLEQPEIKSVNASKNEIAVETLESTNPRTTDKDQQTSLIMERKLQAGLQAQELHKQLDQSGIVTNNQDPDKMIRTPNGAQSNNVIEMGDILITSAVDPQSHGTQSAEDRLPANRKHRNDDSSSQVTGGWDVKQSSKG